MGSFVVDVDPDSVAVVVCRSSASGRVGTKLTNKFLLLRTRRVLIAAGCLIIFIQ